MSEGNQSIAQTVKAIAEGRLTSRQWVEHCLGRIRENEPLGIWSYVDEERALTRADEMDWMRKDGSAFGSLHG